MNTSLLFVSIFQALFVVKCLYGQECDKNFTMNDIPVIESPGYPSPYPAGDECLYTIMFDNPQSTEKVINLRIDNFRTYSSGNNRDLLIVNHRSYHGDGANTTTAMQIGQTYTYRTFNTRFQLQFRSLKASQPQQGFSIIYYVTDGDGNNNKTEECDGRNECGDGGLCHSFGQQGFTCVCNAPLIGPSCQFGSGNTHDCPKEYVGMSGTIESTNHPEHYPNHHVCDMVITGLNPGDGVSLLVEEFITEQNYDILIIQSDVFHGYWLTSETAMLIGETYNYTVSQGGSYLSLLFSTDEDTTFQGFSLNYTVFAANSSTIEG